MWQGNTEKDLYNDPANTRSPEALRVKIVHVRAGSRSGKTTENCLMRTGFSPCSTWFWSAHTSASLHLSGILFYVSNQMSKVKPTTCLYRKSRRFLLKVSSPRNVCCPLP